MTDPVLPKVLAGPIVRRVEADSVSVWIALSVKPTALTLRLFLADVELTGGDHECQVVQLGKALFVALVRRTGLNLLPRKCYQYEIVDKIVDKLVAVLTADETVALTLPGCTRPSFVLPNPVIVADATPNRPGLRLAHASCRKHYGNGSDALALLAQVLVDTAGEPDERPQQLLLTGDQIYADDLPESLLLHIHKQILDLFRWTEQLATADEVKWSTPALARDLISRWQFLQNIGFKHRTRVPEEYHYYDHQLLAFQEWCVMYLLCWSPVLWSGFNPAPVQGVDDEDIAALNAFKAATTHVRKALANIATYMIFDDHDVTDDWFQEQHRTLLATTRAAGSLVPLRIVRNGLLAYSIFQDWGNQPDHYRTSDYATGGYGKFLDVVRYAGSTPPAIFAAGATDDPVLLQQLGCLADNTKPRKSWHYRYAGPDYDIIVLDSRTWRGRWRVNGFDHGEALLTPDAMTLQLGTLDPTRTTFLVAPAPISGFLIVDLAQKAKMAERRLVNPILTESSDVALDYEGWTINTACVDSLIGRFTDRGIRPIVLSGDVHYAYSEWGWRKTHKPGQPERDRREFLQLCCSSAKNTEALTRGLGLTDLLTTSGAATSVLGGDAEIATATLLRMYAEVHIGLRNDDVAVSGYFLAKDAYDGVVAMATQFLTDPAVFAAAHGQDLVQKLNDAVNQASVDAINTLLRRYVLTRALFDLMFGAKAGNAMYAMTGCAERDPLGPLEARPLTDRRKAGRYVPGNWSSLHTGASVNASTCAWYTSYTPPMDPVGLRDRSIFLDYYNFLSVGDTNIGLVDLRSRNGVREVAHALIWALPAEQKQMPLYATNLPSVTAGMPAWAVTLHRDTF